MSGVTTPEENEAQERAEVRALMIERMTRAAIPGVLVRGGLYSEAAGQAIDVATMTVDLLLERFPCLRQ